MPVVEIIEILYLGVLLGTCVCLIGHRIASHTSCNCCEWGDSCQCELHCPKHPYVFPTARIIR